MLKQKAIYWEPLNRNKYGEQEFYLPVEIMVRWEQGSEEILQYDEKEWKPDHTVYSDRDLIKGGLLVGPFGKNEDPMVGLEAPLPPPESALRIKLVRITPTLKATKFLRENFL
jgi:hypothetical protein